MRTLTTATCAAVLAALAGCGSMSLENKRIDYKATAVRAQSLEVPPDLTVPAPGDRYLIPDDGESAANYSDYAKGGGASQAGSRAATVLPEMPNVRLERNGAQRWLVVDAKAESVWPVVKAFFQENGLVVKTDNALAGVIETDWAENRANLPRTGLRSILGKVFDGMYDSGQKDRFRARLERAKDGSGTEIYLTHYGIEEKFNSDKSESRWQDRPNDPDLEVAMLQMLAVKLGGKDAGAEGGATAEGDASSSSSKRPPRMQKQADGTPFIVLSEPFDKSWRKVGLALERAGFAVTDRNRLSGIYFVRADEPPKKKDWMDKLAFWRKDEAPKSERCQVIVQDRGVTSEVVVRNAEGNGAGAPHIIESVFKALQ